MSLGIAQEQTGSDVGSKFEMAELNRHAEMYEPWRIEMLGTLRATRGTADSLTRFRTRKAGLLLAYLACHPQQNHPREQLQEMLWPECDPEVGRNRFKQELASLRRQLEPPGLPQHSVLIADRSQVRLHPQSTTSDVAEFEVAIRSAKRAGTDNVQKSALLIQAVDLYDGELLPGFYDDWVLARRDLLQEDYLAALRSLIRLSEDAGDLPQATAWAYRAIAADPLGEELQTGLIRLHMAQGQCKQAWQHYETYRQRLRAELDITPSEVLQTLADLLRHSSVLPAVPQPAPLPTAELPPALSLTHTVAPTPQSAVPHLPMQFTRFFGREVEAAALIEILRQTRLVTLHGPGGCGKTRLAIETARQAAPNYHGSVFFAGLADLHDGRLFADGIADALCLPRTGRREPLAQITEALSGKPTLLVLDNLEQIAEEAASVVQSLLEQAPALTCLVTSRQVLGLAAEQSYQVSPLSVPTALDSKEAATPAHLLQFASVSLFVDRAQSAQPDFQITARNAAAIAAICDQLEGLPLALELAAAWSPLLAPRQIQERLSERFALLVSRRKDMPERHRTLWAAVQWSYDLLSPQLQRFWTRLSLFRGGWTLEAAQEVCMEPAALSVLVQLHQRALITTENTGEGGEGNRRGRMLETLREFAWTQISDADRREFGQNHCQFFVRLAAASPTERHGPEQEAWLNLLEREHDNLRAALAWCNEYDCRAGLRLTLSLGRFWSIRGYQKEGRMQIQRFLAYATETEIASDDQARAHLCLGDFAREQGDFAEAVHCARRTLALARASGSTEGAASALRLLGLGLGYLGDREAARKTLEEAVSLFRQTKDVLGLTYALLSLGIIAQQQHDYEYAGQVCAEGLALARTQNAPLAVADLLIPLGMNTFYQSDYTSALAFHQESLTIYQKLGSKRGVALSQHNSALALMYLGEYDDAQNYLRQSLSLFQEIGDRWGIETGLTTLAALSARRNELRMTVQIWAAIASFKNVPDPSFLSAGNQLLLSKARAALSAGRFAAEWAAGLRLTPDQALSMAVSSSTVSQETAE